MDPVPEYLLFEDGFRILMEDGLGGALLLESSASAPGASDWSLQPEPTGLWTIQPGP
jgi:hypothetical protein